MAETTELNEDGRLYRVGHLHKTGAQRIKAERLRQITQEGWTPEHDDQHEEGELAIAGALYATPVPLYRHFAMAQEHTYRDPWPQYWHKSWDKRTRDARGRILSGNRLSTEARIRNLEKAGALIAAEIDRLIRLRDREG